MNHVVVAVIIYIAINLNFNTMTQEELKFNNAKIKEANLLQAEIEDLDTILCKIKSRWPILDVRILMDKLGFKINCSSETYIVSKEQEKDLVELLEKWLEKDKQKFSKL